MKKKPAKTKEKKAPAWPPPGEVMTIRLGEPWEKPRFRFRWLTPGGRRRQMTLGLTTSRDRETVERLILQEVARAAERERRRTKGRNREGRP